MKSMLTALIVSVVGALPIVLIFLLYRAVAGCVRVCMSNMDVFRMQCGVFLHTCCCYLERPLGMDAVLIEEKIMTAARSIGEQISDEAIPKALVISGDIIGVLAAIGISWAVFFIFSVLLA